MFFHGLLYILTIGHLELTCLRVAALFVFVNGWVWACRLGCFAAFVFFHACCYIKQIRFAWYHGLGCAGFVCVVCRRAIFAWRDGERIRVSAVDRLGLWSFWWTSAKLVNCLLDDLLFNFRNFIMGLAFGSHQWSAISSSVLLFKIELMDLLHRLMDAQFLDLGHLGVVVPSIGSILLILHNSLKRMLFIRAQLRHIIHVIITVSLIRSSQPVSPLIQLLIITTVFLRVSRNLALMPSSKIVQYLIGIIEYNLIWFILEFLMFFHLLLLSFHFLFMDECIINPIIQICVVIHFVFSIQITAFFAVFYYFALFWSQLRSYVLWPLEQLWVFIVEITVWRIEWRKDYGFLRVILLNRLILNLLSTKLVHFGFDIETFEFGKYSFLWVFLVILLFFEKVLNHVLPDILEILVTCVDVVFFGIQIVLCEDEVAIRNYSRVVR